LLPSSECYFSDNYNPKLKLETVLNDDIFLSEDYLVLDGDKNEVRLFFKKMGIQESIEPIEPTHKLNLDRLMSIYRVFPFSPRKIVW
jgi:hypothetical protein